MSTTQLGNHKSSTSNIVNVGHERLNYKHFNVCVNAVFQVLLSRTDRCQEQPKFYDMLIKILHGPYTSKMVK